MSVCLSVCLSVCMYVCMFIYNVYLHSVKSDWMVQVF